LFIKVQEKISLLPGLVIAWEGNLNLLMDVWQILVLRFHFMGGRGYLLCFVLYCVFARLVAFFVFGSFTLLMHFASDYSMQRNIGFLF